MFILFNDGTVLEMPEFYFKGGYLYGKPKTSPLAPIEAIIWTGNIVPDKADIELKMLNVSPVIKVIEPVRTCPLVMCCRPEDEVRWCEQYECPMRDMLNREELSDGG